MPPHDASVPRDPCSDRGSLPLTIRVGVLGAGSWAESAHLPGFRRDDRCDVVAIADVVPGRARRIADQFGIADAYQRHDELLARRDIDVVDVCTPTLTHFELTMAALHAGKHVLCEKPVAEDFRDTRRAADLARRKGLRTKVGHTFRYSPAMQYARELIDQGFIGTPFIFNGYEQNSQWLDPRTPLRQEDHEAGQDALQVSALQSYGAPIMDIAHLFMGSRFSQVIGTMKNFVPVRMVRATGTMLRMNIDDGDIFIGEFENGALGSIQTSYVTVGNYPGLEARVYGSRGALVCRLVEENGLSECLMGASIDDVEFRPLEVPLRFYPEGSTRNESWRSLFYKNLVSAFLSDILSGDSTDSEGDFEDSAHVQELINAVATSCRERRWVSLPLPVA